MLLATCVLTCVTASVWLNVLEKKIAHFHTFNTLYRPVNVVKAHWKLQKFWKLKSREVLKLDLALRFDFPER